MTLFKPSQTHFPGSDSGTFAGSFSGRFAGLIAGCALAFLPQIANTQTLTDIQALMKDGKTTLALEQVDRYLVAQPQDAQGLFAKGLILSELGRAQEAIAVFTRLTGKYPKLPEPYNNLAVLYAAQKQYDKARAALEIALQTHPSYAAAHENLSTIYAQLASQAYSKALQPDSPNRATQTKLSMINAMSLPESSVSLSTTSTSPPVIALAKNGTPPSPSPSGDNREAQTVTLRDMENEIQKTVHDWAAAWSKKDVKTYLAFYASNFQPSNGRPLKQWEKERRQRIDKPGKLQVSVHDLQVSFPESGRERENATVRFQQQYASATLNSQTHKTLVFVKSGNRWLILQEQDIPAVALEKPTETTSVKADDTRTEPSAPPAVPPAPTVSATPAAPATPATSIAPATQPTQTILPSPQEVGKPDDKTSQTTALHEMENEIQKTIHDWAAAWSRKDVKTYLSFYASNFQTPDGKSLKQWEDERRQRIEKPGKLQVSVHDIQIAFAKSGQPLCRTHFQQHYVSATLKSQTRKTLILVKSGTRWLIVQERVS